MTAPRSRRMVSGLYVGLMSGTSLDGVDAALIETDGHSYAKPLDFVTIPYTQAVRDQIRSVFGRSDRTAPDVKAAEQVLTQEHSVAVGMLLSKAGRKAKTIDLIGFHGQTIFHAPRNGVTVQIGDGAMLAREAGIDVVADMRANDVKQGGEGAPLAPLYHRARVNTAQVEKPVVILNIGGVGNVTWIGEGDGDILAFDTGPGNALMDDWVQKHTGARYDEDGKLAQAGTPAQALIDSWMAHDYFTRRPPKSLDRNQWDIAEMGQLPQDINALSVEDGAATLLEFTAQGILRAVDCMPQMPAHWYVCGGGRHNKALMHRLTMTLPGKVDGVEALGWNGDATEAECFAYLAVRSHLGLPLSLPTTTGVKKPTTGGVRFAA